MQDFIAQFNRIDLSAPWLIPFGDIHHAFDKDKDKLQGGLAPWLNAYFAKENIVPRHHDNGTPLTFTAQDDLPHGTAYERHIYQSHKIPTRDNLHDWFGACIWSAFPKTKALLNAKHHAHMSADNHRNRLRDTITVFDENGAILLVSDETIGYDIADALAQFDWQNCLINSRQYWHDPTSPKDSDKAQILLFGHALLEQLITPRKPLCSHTVILNVPPTFFGLPLDKKLAFVDGFLCWRLDKLLQDGVTPRTLNPLPILGVPYFWDNDDPAFYDDEFVFRSGRKDKTNS